MTNLRGLRPGPGETSAPGNGHLATVSPPGSRRTVNVLPRTVSASGPESHVWASRCGATTTRPGPPARDEPHAASFGDGGKGAAGQHGKVAHRGSEPRHRANARFAQGPPEDAFGRDRAEPASLRVWPAANRARGRGSAPRSRWPRVPGLSRPSAGVRGESLLARFGPLGERPDGQRRRPSERDERERRRRPRRACDGLAAARSRSRRRSGSCRRARRARRARERRGRSRSAAARPAPRDAAKDARRFQCPEHALERLGSTDGVAREVVDGVRDLRPRGGDEVVEEARDEISLAFVQTCQRALEMLLDDPLGPAELGKRRSAQDVRASRRSTSQSRSRTSWRYGASTRRARSGLLDEPAPGQMSLDPARRDLVENRLDELVARPSLGSTELGVRPVAGLRSPTAQPRG